MADRTVEISGTSCPQLLYYTYYFSDTGPDSDRFVDESEADVRAAFRSLIKK